MTLVFHFCYMSSVRSTSDGRGPVTRKRVPGRSQGNLARTPDVAVVIPLNNFLGPADETITTKHITEYRIQNTGLEYTPVVLRNDSPGAPSPSPKTNTQHNIDLRGLERHYWNGTEEGLLGCYDFPGESWAGDGSVDKGSMGAGIVCLQRPTCIIVVRVGREEEGVSSLRRN